MLWSSAQFSPICRLELLTGLSFPWRHDLPASWCEAALELRPDSARGTRGRTAILLTGLAKVQAVAQADAAAHDYVGVLRGRGVSWTRFGAAFGVSKQAAWERFSGAGRPPAPGCFSPMRAAPSEDPDRCGPPSLTGRWCGTLDGW